MPQKFAFTDDITSLQSNDNGLHNIFHCLVLSQKGARANIIQNSGWIHNSNQSYLKTVIYIFVWSTETLFGSIKKPRYISPTFDLRYDMNN